MFFSFSNHTTQDVPHASQTSRDLYDWAVKKQYTLLNEKELRAQLEEFGSHLTEFKQGMLFLALIVDRSMPGDAREDLLYNPTYAAACAFIHAFNTHPDWFKAGKYLTWLQGILKACTGRGLTGHGMFGGDAYHRNVKLFESAGVKAFILHAPAGCEDFCRLF